MVDQGKKQLRYKKHKKYNKETNAKKYYKKKMANRPLENLGRSLGSYFGETGSKVGKYLGRAAGIITGSGSYQIHKNTLCNQQVPFVHSSSEMVRIKHREFLGNVNGSTTFNIQSYNINPGLSATFPWLYTTAASFEQYKIEGLVVQFTSTAGNAISSTNNSLGSVCLATDYNVVNEDFTTMAQCQNSMWSNTAKPSENIMMPIECDGKLNVLDRLFIRNNETSLANSDLRLYDHCKIYLATEGMQVATQIGQLWISYDIILYKPVLKDPPKQKIAFFNLGSFSNGFFTNRTERANSIGVYFNNSSYSGGYRIYFPKSCVNKKYIIYFAIHNINSTFNWNDVNYTLVNCSSSNLFINQTAAMLDTPGGPGAITNINAQSLIVCLNVDAADGYIDFSGGIQLPSGDLFIAQYSI